MAFDPQPGDFVFSGEAVENLPEVRVFYGFFVRGFPTVSLPVVNPLADTFLHVLRIGMDVNLNRAFECSERLDDCSQFHPVVGGIGFAAPEFLFGASGLQENAPAARAGVAATSAIGVNMSDEFIGHVVRFPCALLW